MYRTQEIWKESSNIYTTTVIRPFAQNQLDMKLLYILCKECYILESIVKLACIYYVL